jgi:hypothetical protein
MCIDVSDELPTSAYGAAMASDAAASSVGLGVGVAVGTGVAVGVGAGVAVGVGTGVAVGVGDGDAACASGAEAPGVDAASGGVAAAPPQAASIETARAVIASRIGVVLVCIG